MGFSYLAGSLVDSNENIVLQGKWSSMVVVPRRPIKRAQVKAGFIIELTFSTTFVDEGTPTPILSDFALNCNTIVATAMLDIS